MAKSYIKMKFQEFKDKFNSFFVQKKKVRALENYARVAPLSTEEHIRLNTRLDFIKDLMDEGFIDEVEEGFLNHQLKKLEVNAWDWCYKTPWLKKEMARIALESGTRKQHQLYFPEPNLTPSFKISGPLIAMNKRNTAYRSGAHA